MGFFNEALGQLGSVLKSVAEHAIPGAGNVIKTVEALGAAFDHLKEANGGSAPPAAQVDRDAALARVLKHAEDTASRLDG